MPSSFTQRARETAEMAEVGLVHYPCPVCLYKIQMTAVSHKQSWRVRQILTNHIQHWRNDQLIRTQVNVSIVILVDNRNPCSCRTDGNVR